MKIYFTFIIALVAIGFTACNSIDKNNNTSSTNVEDSKDLTKGSSTDEGASIMQAVLLNDVYDRYFSLIEALANDDGKVAQTASKSLHKAISEAPKDKMNADQQDTWEEYQRKLSYDAEHIMGINETPHQREHLVTLSKNMYEVMRVLTPAKTVYYQNCPMYDDNKGGNWLSYDSKIKNPYYGKSMLGCGETIDSIKN